MRVLTILFCSIFISCVPLQVLFTSSSASEKVPDYRELEVDYQLAFEKRLSKDYAALSQLVNRTQLALDQGKLTVEQQVEVRRWQHKLRSFISFAMLAMREDKKQPVPADIANEPSEGGNLQNENKHEQVRGLAALIFDRLRVADPSRINHEQSNHAFYQLVNNNQLDNKKVSQQAKDNFSRALVGRSLELTEKSVRKYYRLFPFAQQSYATACKKVAGADCQHLQLQELAGDAFTEQPFTSVEQVTAAVNKTITDLNSLITMLSRLKATKDVFFIFKETDFDNLGVQRLYSVYEMTLFNAARRGFLPVLFAPTFRARAGNIYLQKKGGLDFLQRLGLKKDIAYEVGDIKNPLLTEVSQATVEQSITEIQQQTIARWVELRQLKSADKTFADKKLYQWTITNEIATAQVILQDPAHSIPVMHLLNHYQYQNRDPAAVRIIRGVTEVIEISMLPLLFGGAAALTGIFPALAGISLMGKAITVAVAANFVWVGMAGVSTHLTQQRWLQLERALLTGSSERYEDNLKLLREFHKTRRNAIISGTIGLPLSVPSIRYAVNHMYDGGKTMLVDAVAGVFSARDEFGYEGLSDVDVHQGR